MIRRPLIALAFLLAACGAGETSSPETSPPSTPAPTVPGVGQLPDTVPTPSVEAGVVVNAEVPASIEITRPVDDDGALLDTVAEQVNGNRVIAIGDSILASTSTRYGGEMCAVLNPLGWDVEVDAEPGRFVDFGNQVLTDRLSNDLPDDEDFDAAIVHLGSNYREDRDEYYTELSEILFRIAPRPTLLMNVTEYRPAWAEVNDVIDELAALYDNVTVIDWENVSSVPGVLSGDGLHPGNQGEAALVDLLAVALGTISDDAGECLPTSFTDDSLVDRGSGTSSGGSNSDFSTGTASSNSGNSSSSSSSSSGGGTSDNSSGGSSSGGGSTGGDGGGAPEPTQPPAPQPTQPPAPQPTQPPAPEPTQPPAPQPTQPPAPVATAAP